MANAVGLLGEESSAPRLLGMLSSNSGADRDVPTIPATSHIGGEMKVVSLWIGSVASQDPHSFDEMCFARDEWHNFWWDRMAQLQVVRDRLMWTNMHAPD